MGEVSVLTLQMPLFGRMTSRHGTSEGPQPGLGARFAKGRQLRATRSGRDEPDAGFAARRTGENKGVRAGGIRAENGSGVADSGRILTVRMGRRVCQRYALQRLVLKAVRSFFGYLPTGHDAAVNSRQAA